MPLTKKELEQLESILDLLDDSISQATAAKIKTLLSKFVGDDPPPAVALPDRYGSHYKGPGCHICIGQPKPPPCKFCGFPDGKPPAKQREEAEATILVECIGNPADGGVNSWLNVPASLADGAEVIIGDSVYKAVDNKLAW